MLLSCRNQCFWRWTLVNLLLTIKTAYLHVINACLSSNNWTTSRAQTQAGKLPVLIILSCTQIFLSKHHFMEITDISMQLFVYFNFTHCSIGAKWFPLLTEKWNCSWELEVKYKTHKKTSLSNHAKARVHFEINTEGGINYVYCLQQLSFLWYSW